MAWTSPPLENEVELKIILHYYNTLDPHEIEQNEAPYRQRSRHYLNSKPTQTHMILPQT